MRGTVIKRGKAWSVVLDVGRDNTGRRIRRWHSGFSTRREAEQARIELLGRVDRGSYVQPEKVTLARFLTDEWLPATRATIRSTTWASYRMNIEKHIAPSSLGAVQLQRLTPAAVNSFYAELLLHGRRDGKGGLAPKTVRNLHGALHKALSDAVRWGKVARNVADLADPPRWERPEMKVWSPQELRHFLDTVRNDRLEAAWVLAATTGMRRGELLGLRWSDVHLEREMLNVVQTLAVVDYQVRYSEPKTAKGRRAVALDRDTVSALRAHRARQAEERLAIGAGWRDDGLVFTRPDGEPIHPQRFSTWFNQHSARSGLPRIRLHDLRHTHATLALTAGVDVKVVSERLGHANTGITSDTYQHVSSEMQHDAALRVAALVFVKE